MSDWWNTSAESGVWRLEPEFGCALVILRACVLWSIESPEFQPSLRGMCAGWSPTGAGPSLCACGFWPESALKVWPASERDVYWDSGKAARRPNRSTFLQVEQKVRGGESYRRELYLWKSDGINVNKQFLVGGNMIKSLTHEGFIWGLFALPEKLVEGAFCSKSVNYFHSKQVK